MNDSDIAKAIYAALRPSSATIMPPREERSIEYKRQRWRVFPNERPKSMVAEIDAALARRDIVFKVHKSVEIRHICGHLYSHATSDAMLRFLTTCKCPACAAEALGVGDGVLQER